MSGINESSDFSDVDNSSYIAGSVSINTSQTELKVGASRLTSRQNIIIQNTGNNVAYLGPSGVTTTTGIPLLKNQFISLPLGDNIALYAITASSTTTLVVHEVG